MQQRSYGTSFQLFFKNLELIKGTISQLDNFCRNVWRIWLFWETADYSIYFLGWLTHGYINESIS